jgi:hypothetical protein
VVFLENEALPKLNVLEIFNWEGHNFVYHSETLLKGCPYGRDSASGTSFHIWFDGSHWAWQDKATGVGGGAVQYRWMLKGGTGTPKGQDYVAIVRELAAEAGLELPRFESQKKESSEAIKELTPEEKKAEAEAWKVEEKRRKDWAIAKDLETFHNLVHFVPKGKTFYSDARFISDDFLDKMPETGLVFVQAAMGQGKSVLIQKLLALFPDRPVLSVVPTTAVGKAQQTEWKLFMRDTSVTIEGENVTEIILAAKRQILCWDSIHRTQGKSNQDLILVIDEA